MKSTSLLASCVALAGSATAQGGFIYTIDQSVVSSSTATINAETASSIIARRRGLTEGRAFGTPDEAIVNTLKNYGGWQQPLFGQVDEDAPGKLFIRISGFDGQVMDLSAAMPDLWIEEPTSDLKSDFKADPRRDDGICEYAVPTSSKNKDIEVVFSYPAEGDLGCLDASEIPSLPITLAIQSVIPTTAASIPSTISPLKRILSHLLATQGVESTIVLLPSKLTKAPAKPASHAHNKRAEETPLTLTPEGKDPAHALKPEGKDQVHALAGNSTKSNVTHPLPSAIQECFKDASSCNNVTNSCSGHGSCYEARNGCFKCKCKPTVLSSGENGEGRKTVEWGGLACEKKDVSVPFMLFATFGVAMTALIAGVIAMLFNMGSETLPSVLSAGVSGPTARK